MNISTESGPREDRSLRRLVNWNRFWLALLLAAAMVWTAAMLLNQTSAGVRELRVQWVTEGLRLSSTSDGPFVVTHLLRLGNGGPEKAVARLPESIVIIDSGGATINSETYRKLVWKDIQGTPVPAPPEGSPIRALYYRPSYSEPAAP